MAFVNKYRTVQTSFWRDPWVLSLPPEEKFFYLYLFVNEYVQDCGVYEFSLYNFVHQTGHSAEKIVEMLNIFIAEKKVIISGNEICVVNFIKHNMRKKKNDKGLSKPIKDCLIAAAATVKNKSLIYITVMQCEKYQRDLLAPLLYAYMRIPDDSCREWWHESWYGSHTRFETPIFLRVFYNNKFPIIKINIQMKDNELQQKYTSRDTGGSTTGVLKENKNNTLTPLKKTGEINFDFEKSEGLGSAQNFSSAPPDVDKSQDSPELPSDSQSDQGQSGVIPPTALPLPPAGATDPVVTQPEPELELSRDDLESPEPGFDLNPKPGTDSPVLPEPKAGQNISQTQGSPILTEVTIPILPQENKFITVRFYANDSYTCQQLCAYLKTNHELLIMNQRLHLMPMDFVQHIFEYFIRFVLSSGKEFHENKLRECMVYLLQYRFDVIEKDFVKSKQTIAYFMDELEKCKNLCPDEKMLKRFVNFYTSTLGSGRYYFQTLKNFIVADCLKTWVETDFKKIKQIERKTKTPILPVAGSSLEDIEKSYGLG